MVHYEVFVLRTVSHPFINYSYIVFDKSSRSAIIIDPSWELDTIIGKLNDLNADVKGIMLTHSHYDHVNLASVLTEIYECDVFMSSVEIEDYGFNCRHLRGLSDHEVVVFGETNVTCLWTPGILREVCVFCLKTVFLRGIHSLLKAAGDAILRAAPLRRCFIAFKKSNLLRLRNCGYFLVIPMGPLLVKR